MIFPYSVKEFMTTFFEQRAVIIKRKKFDFYKDLFSTRQMAEIIERNPIQFGVNLGKGLKTFKLKVKKTSFMVFCWLKKVNFIKICRTTENSPELRRNIMDKSRR